MNAHSPKYASHDESLIDLVLEHPDLGNIPFTANANDIEPLGCDLYARAKALEFGPIADYDGPSAEELLTDEIRSERNSRLIELDAIVSNPLRWDEFSSSQKIEIGIYRQALLDVPQQSGFPSNINWPIKPAYLDGNYQQEPPGPPPPPPGPPPHPPPPPPGPSPLDPPPVGIPPH